MNELLRDPLWQFVGAVLAVLAIIVSVILYFLQRSRKSLAYKVISNTALLSPNEEIKKDLQLTYKGNPVKNVHLFVFKIINNGNQPISSNDFEKPLYFNLSGDVKILSAEVVSVKPYNLNPQIAFDENRIAVAPLLLNSKDFIKIKAIIDAERFGFKPDARINNVSEVKDIDKEKPRKAVKRMAVIMVLIIGYFFALIFGYSWGVLLSSALLVIYVVFAVIRSFYEDKK